MMLDETCKRQWTCTVVVQSLYGFYTAQCSLNLTTMYNQHAQKNPLLKIRPGGEFMYMY
jgi:hypothetical protein